jgi:superfamily II DNA or RNA helicase
MKLKRFKGVIDSHVNIYGLPKKVREALVKTNTVENPAYATAERFSSYNAVADTIPATLEFAWDFNGEIQMHRGCLEKLPTKYERIPSLIKWEDKRVSVPADFPDLKLTWNEEQKYCMEALEDVIAHNRRPFGSLLFIASTAVGKTILQASIAARLGQRTLVLCPTELIMRAWYDDLNKAFGLSRSRLGLIKQSKEEIGDTFTLASIQTLGRRREKWEEFNQEFGTIVVDEVQGCAAETMFAFLSQSPAKYMVGATATMDTRSGPNLHLKALFGSPIVTVNSYHRETASSMPISEVKLINTNFVYRHQVDNLDWNDFALHITGDEDRNNLIVQNVKKDWEQGGVCLVTTKTRDHSALLLEMLLEAGVENANEINGDTNTNKFYTDKLLGMVSDRKVTCLVATAQAIKTGANIPNLDRLHIAMPPANKNDWEQLAGRIRRRAEGKTSATITYYYDAKVAYVVNLYKRVIIPVFRRMKVPGYEGLFVA